MQRLLVSDLMSEVPLTLHPDENLLLAENLMEAVRIRHLPVVDADGKLVGIVTQSDILRAQASSLAALDAEVMGSIKGSITARSIMQTKVRTATPTESALAAGARLRGYRIGCLPVVDDGRVVGIVTASDYLDLALRFLGAAEDETVAELY